MHGPEGLLTCNSLQDWGLQLQAIKKPAPFSFAATNMMRSQLGFLGATTSGQYNIPRLTKT